MSTQVHVHVHVRQHVHGISYHVHVAKVRGPQFNPGWLPGFHSSLKAFPHVHVQTNYKAFLTKTRPGNREATFRR